MQHYRTPNDVSAELCARLEKWGPIANFHSLHPEMDGGACPCLQMDVYPARVALLWIEIKVLLKRYENSESRSQSLPQDQYLKDCGEVLDKMDAEYQNFLKEWGPQVQMLLAPQAPPAPPADNPRRTSGQGQGR